MHKQSDYFLKHIAQTSDAPLLLEIERAEGIYLYAKDKTYIDCISGIGVSNTGHGNKKIIDAVCRQAGKYMHLMVYGELVQEPQVQLAKLLTDNLPDTLNSCYFVNSGSEAIEGAMKLAKRFTGRHHFTALENAYHGSTQGALSLMSNDYFSNKYYPLLPSVSFARQNNPEDIEKLITTETAAVFIEPIMGEAGYLPCDKEYLIAIRKRCDETGALLVFDEIQSGYGRTGSLFAFEQYGIVPDILVLAKGMGGGMPLGAFIADSSVMSCFMDNPVLGHITTFGGHPVSCAASKAALEFIIENDLHKKVSDKSELFKSLLKHPAILKINGKGLMLALTFESITVNRAIIAKCIENGLLTDWFLYNENCMRIAPPLIITEAQIHEVCSIINSSVKEICG
ncbi:MAG: aspartate aminotransferase family protein [Bacteroidia bacterium]|nr:aspartate aminotransferase family protein [Bacteroidia bacterium]